MESPLLKEKVKIYHGISTPYTGIKFNPVKIKESLTQLYAGEIKAEMNNAYGENDFIVIYQEQEYAFFRQFKTNRRHQHDYNFHIFKKDDKLFLQVMIVGIDGEEFVTPFSKPYENKK